MSSATVKKLRQAVQRRPDDSDAWYALGLAAVQSGDHVQGAQAILQSALVGAPPLDRMLAAAHLSRGAGQTADAERVMRRAVAYFPQQAETQAELAAVLLEAGRDREALDVIGAALPLHPHAPPLHLVAASIQERLGSVAAAADHLTAVLAVDAAHPEANRRLAGYLDRMGDSAGAVDCWRRVVTVTAATDSAVLTQLGIALSKDGQHAEAVHLLSQVAERHPDLSAVHADLGMALLGAGRLQEAAGVWSRALEVDPQSAQAYCGIGLAYQKLGRVLEAAEAFKTTELLAPDNPEGPFNLGLALTALGDREGARRALLRAAALDPNDHEITASLDSLLGQNAADSIESGVAATISGDLARFQLLDVLELLRVQRKTGKLVVTSPEGTGTLRLVGGAATGGSAPGIASVAAVLLERNIINRAEFEGIPSQADGGDDLETLKAVLRRGRAADRAQLTQVLFQQVFAALEKILAWREGAFSFQVTEEEDSLAIAIDLQKVAVELARAADVRAGRTKTS